MSPLRRSVAFAAQTLTVPVPKNRRPKFELHLRIIDLNNVPLVSGTSFIKWHLSHSTAAEHRGRTESCPVRDHKVVYNYDISLPVRLTVDKNGMLQESCAEFEVIQEYGGGSGRGERITLGHVKLNLAEYVEQSEMAAAQGEDPGVTRRYLMQDSKINSTLKLGIYMRQTEGDKNFIAPALKTAQVFSGIAGIMAGEQAELEDSGTAPSLSSKSRETGELQDMYRRTLAAYWSAQPGELKADECIEDIFAGGNGWGDREKPYSQQQQRNIGTRFLAGDSSGSVSESESRHMRGNSSTHRKSHETLRPGDMNSKSPNVRGRGSLEQQASQLAAEAARKRHRPHHEVDEFDLREDLCSWRRPI
ncbi:N-terminal C2 in EEIG1 and EHBP1 proteins-domain-containing protein [Pyrenochaeta sp. MPI-SDFR-AT-0127]|nr:N-terminal C2 in EEIG1 and EHBP1 proteins-domain-containing protein [Pyrenochaeta sp. MPI-SDFR-AT-0127]